MRLRTQKNKVAWSLIPRKGFRLPAPEVAMQGANWEETEEYGDAGWKGVLHSCLSLAHSRRCNVLSFGHDYGSSSLLAWAFGCG